MANFPTGQYNCIFQSSDFLVEELSGGSVAEIPVNYSDDYIFISLEDTTFGIGTGDFENIEKDGFSETDSLELGSSNINDTTYIVEAVSGSREYNLASLNEIRLYKTESNLKIYTKS